ncbi:thyroid peroxidase-like isoform X2 [Sinocyclocheilus grahami]|uniref:thyroid peroxidase-like isoform X2 n=1 Tax=Sinocyclocheilus grahami TaxID=75366 RepID=UPI0007AD5564|nr:PREDICTED: thyroid peroxidase-like isoform X2 [Sinocyclocheilus grahami]
MYQCPTGYLLQGATQITCDPNTHQWTPQTPTCQDIDECSTHPSVCPPHLQCLNTPGGHTCTEPAAPPLSASSIVASVVSVLGGVALIVLFLACYQRLFLRKAEPVKVECCRRS